MQIFPLFEINFHNLLFKKKTIREFLFIRRNTAHSCLLPFNCITTITNCICAT